MTTLAIATAIANSMKDDWHAAPAYDRAAFLRRDSDNLELFMYSDWRNKPAVRLSAAKENGRDITSSACPEIGVNWLTRSPDKVARDIERRLLPVAEQVDKLAIEEFERQQQYQIEYDSGMELLTAELGADFSQRRYAFPPIGTTDRYAELEYNSSGSVKLEMTIPPALAVKLLRAMREL